MDQEQVVSLMESATSESDWNTKADQVKTACGGYPPFWFRAIVVSGLSGRAAKRFGGDADIHLISPAPSE